LDTAAVIPGRPAFTRVPGHIFVLAGSDAIADPTEPVPNAAAQGIRLLGKIILLLNAVAYIRETTTPPQPVWALAGVALACEQIHTLGYRKLHWILLSKGLLLASLVYGVAWWRTAEISTHAQTILYCVALASP
jgi:hypothetical protein